MADMRRTEYPGGGADLFFLTLTLIYTLNGSYKKPCI